MAYSTDSTGYFATPRSRLFLLAVILLAVGSIITFIAVSTPGWQIGYVAEYQQHLESGLWIFCERRPVLGTACTYSISGNDYNTDQPQNYDFLKTPPFYSQFFASFSLLKSFLQFDGRCLFSKLL